VKRPKLMLVERGDALTPWMKNYLLETNDDVTPVCTSCAALMNVYGQASEGVC